MTGLICFIYAGNFASWCGGCSSVQRKKWKKLTSQYKKLESNRESIVDFMSCHNSKKPKLAVSFEINFIVSYKFSSS